MRGFVLHSLSVFVALYFFWILLSGYFTVFLLSAGAGCALAVVWISHRFDVIDHEGHPVHLRARALLSYWPWLAWEIAKSAWDVTKIILDPKLPIGPAMVRFKPSQTTDLGRVVHANSITLTPGTITVQAEGGEFLVHALTRASAEGVVSGDMDTRVSALERHA